MKTLQINKSKEGYDKGAVLRWLSISLDAVRNGVYDLTLVKHVEQRSTPQNRLLHFWFRCISAETGETLDRVKMYYKEMFLPRRISTFQGRDYEVIPSTKDLTEDEMTEFLNAIQADAASELGIRLPNRDDQYFEEFVSMYN